MDKNSMLLFKKLVKDISFLSGKLYYKKNNLIFTSEYLYILCLI